QNLQIKILSDAIKLFGPQDPEQPSDNNIKHFYNGAIQLYSEAETGEVSAILVEVDGERHGFFGPLEWVEKIIQKNGGGDPFTALKKSIREDMAAIETEAERKARADQERDEAAAIVRDILTGSRKPKQDKSGRWWLGLGSVAIVVEPDDSTEELARLAIETLNEELEDLGIDLLRFEAGRIFTEEEIARAEAGLAKPEKPEPPADPAPQPQHDSKAADRPELKPDHNEANRFLTVFDPNTDQFTFQTFDDNKERKRARAEANKLRKQQGKPKLKDPLARTRHGTLAKHWNELVELNNKGAGIYFTVCETDLKGRKTNNIKRVRAGFSDLDGAPLEPVLADGELKTHIITETSPGRFHTYYIVEGIPLDHFEPLQKAIATRFNGDPAVHDLPRVMRLPGFIHRKGEPFLVRILQINDLKPYPWKVLQEAFPPSTTHRKAIPGFEVAPEFKDLPVEDLGEGIPDRPGQELSEQWKKLNSEAIRRYSDWVPDIFPTPNSTSDGG